MPRLRLNLRNQKVSNVTGNKPKYIELDPVPLADPPTDKVRAKPACSSFATFVVNCTITGFPYEKDKFKKYYDLGYTSYEVFERSFEQYLDSQKSNDDSKISISKEA